MSESHAVANGHGDRADSPNGVYPTETLDAIIVGAGFAGVYILVRLLRTNRCHLFESAGRLTTTLIHSINSDKRDSRLR